jgi:hypothetical protein
MMTRQPTYGLGSSQRVRQLRLGVALLAVVLAASHKAIADIACGSTSLYFYSGEASSEEQATKLEAYSEALGRLATQVTEAADAAGFACEKNTCTHPDIADPYSCLSRDPVVIGQVDVRYTPCGTDCWIATVTSSNNWTLSCDECPSGGPQPLPG